MRGGWLACGALALLLPFAPAHATAPITDSRVHSAVPAADSSVEGIARKAERRALSITTNGVGFGIGLMLAAFPARSGGVLLLGWGVCGAGVIEGPAAGWGAAGYAGRGTTGALLRAGLIVGSVALPLLSRDTRQSELVAVALASSGAVGLALATFEAYAECDGIAPYVRKNGPGRIALGLGPATSPSGAPGLALVAHF